jgi:hypothetical protein
MLRWLQTALRRDIVRRSLKVGAVVGTILVTINQGDALLAGAITGEIVTKILLTYCVPYCVSTYASVSAVLAAD